ncbi:tRNA (guanine-N(7)-)-methyltransferase non-catalytic subunit WDR4 isoform X1 [Oryzias latipes]|uniref:WD repeat domain 4 n=1 Tax=Oryzias latipes TaxID=8090 RepID=H2N2W4_ORYLA|nr:tRNA (guanine-N(7)-)-methyltransferase non-catalytic subunit WDR4 isoform X1 [Oryzias latipes]
MFGKVKHRHRVYFSARPLGQKTHEEETGGNVTSFIGDCARVCLSVHRRRGNMRTLGFCGDWLVTSCGTKLVAVHTKEDREAFVFDCSLAEKKPKQTKGDDTSEETGNDEVLAVATSASGKLLALTDDTKRLVLFGCEPSWRCISTRWVVRRCTALTFSRAEDELLLADKSGDVYSFSVVEAQRDGELKLGHLSMLLAVVISPDDRFIITADRDEKIRVSHRRSPYNIQAFCLGHRQFVSALHIPAGRPDWLLSGSGDGTVKLWEFESGRQLQSWELQQDVSAAEQNQNQVHPAADQDAAVCSVTSSPDAHHVAILCERDSSRHLFCLDSDGGTGFGPPHMLSLACSPLDVSFDQEGRLWVLMDSCEDPVQVLCCSQSGWQSLRGGSGGPELCRVMGGLKPHWSRSEASTRSFQHLFKVSYDNVTSYLQKKQQRLEEQLKRRAAQEEKSNKKSRGEESSPENPEEPENI